jgi:hypothetical protein
VASLPQIVVDVKHGGPGLRVTPDADKTAGGVINNQNT